MMALDEKQRNTGFVSLRKMEDDELARMASDPSYSSPLAVLREARFAELEQRIPRLQSRIQYHILETHKASFDATIRKSFSDRTRYDTDSTVGFGTVMRRDFGAYVQYMPRQGGSLIVFNEVLWEGLRYMSDLLSAPLRLGDGKVPFKIDYEVARREVDRFGRVLRRIIRREHLNGIEIQPEAAKEPLWRNLWTDLHNAMEMFVFGHEYGHVLHRHVQQGNVDVAGHWRREYEADRTALDLVIMTEMREGKSKKAPLNIMVFLCGCALMFKYLDLIDEFDFCATPASSHHPPCIFRYAAFKSTCREQLGNEGLGFLDGILSIFDNLLAFYAEHAAEYIVGELPRARDLEARVERAVQKSLFWQMMRKTHDAAIADIEALISRLDHQDEPPREGIREPNDLRAIYSIRFFIGWDVLSFKGVEELLSACLANGFLGKQTLRRMLENCREIYITNRTVVNAYKCT